VADTPIVLVVEDEFLLAMTLDAHLSDLGYHVRLAPNAVAGMALLEAEAAGLACLMTDIRLGAGPTGWELARWARERNVTLPVIYMSGDSILDWSTWGVPESLMLLKPFNLAQLTEAITQIVDPTVA
jgi:two-component system OmpR family response regulator